MTLLVYALIPPQRENGELIKESGDTAASDITIREIPLNPRAKEVPHIPPAHIRKSLKENQATLFLSKKLSNSNEIPILDTTDICAIDETEASTNILSIKPPISVSQKAPSPMPTPIASSSQIETQTDISHLETANRIKVIANKACLEVRRAFIAYNNPPFYDIKPTRDGNFRFFWTDTIMPEEIQARNALLIDYKHKILPDWTKSAFERLNERFFSANIDPTLTAHERDAIQDLFLNDQPLRDVFYNHLKMVVEATGIKYLNGGHCVDFAQHAAWRLLQAFDKESMVTKPLITVIRLKAPAPGREHEDTHFVVGIDINPKELIPGELFVNIPLTRGYICDAWFHQGAALLASNEISSSPLYRMNYRIEEVEVFNQPLDLQKSVKNVINIIKKQWPAFEKAPEGLDAHQKVMTSPVVLKFFDKELRRIYTEKLLVPSDILSRLKQRRNEIEAVIKEGDKIRRPESQTSFKKGPRR